MNKEEINELIMLLPINIRESKEFTNKTKLVLAQLILMNGMDKAKNDGYFFVTNQKLISELGISEPTLIKKLRELEVCGYINRKAGKRGEASEYTINEELIFSENLSNKNENLSNKNQNLSNMENFSNKLENIVINYSNKIDELTLIINDLLKSNQELTKKIEELMSNQNLSNKNENFSTDTESDTELELDINNKLNNNIKIKENKILENKEYFNEEFFKLLEEKDKEIENKKRKKSELTWKGDKVDEPLSPYEEYLFNKAESSSIF